MTDWISVTMSREAWESLLTAHSAFINDRCAGASEIAAEEAIVRPIVTALEDSWKPGGPRCDQCDNGLNRDWAFCPYCGEKTWLVDDPDS